MNQVDFLKDDIAPAIVELYQIEAEQIEISSVYPVE